MAIGGHTVISPVTLHAGREAALLVATGRARPILGGRFAISLVELVGPEGPSPRRRLVGGAELEALDLAAFAAPRPAFFNRPRIMGILNVTPDSFSDGGLFVDHGRAVERGLAMLDEGADIIDVGGESTRPGAGEVPAAEQLRRVLPVITPLAQAGARVSVDTRKAAVMQAAIGAGATLINDVSGLTADADAPAVAAASGALVVVMHMQGQPATMNRAPRYRDAALEVMAWLAARLDMLETAGLPRRRVIVDPGLCFGKHEPHNLDLMRHLAMLHGLGCPLLLGASRKGWTARIQQYRPPARRLPGSLTAAFWALERGVQLLRVHDVEATRQVVDAWSALVAAD